MRLRVFIGCESMIRNWKNYLTSRICGRFRGSSGREDGRGSRRGTSRCLCEISACRKSTPSKFRRLDGFYFVYLITLRAEDVSLFASTFRALLRRRPPSRLARRAFLGVRSDTRTRGVVLHRRGAVNLLPPSAAQDGAVKCR